MRDGLLVLDKPGGITSRDAVDAALRWFPRGTKMGHTGTLDPLATGVLVLCLGRATRLAEYIQQMGKTYRSTNRLGARSTTDDADGILTPTQDVLIPDRATVAAALQTFVGAIEQTPPAFSAAKVTGRRAYSMARKGQEVNLPRRAIHIHGIELIRYEYPELEIEVRCGKGTYIRSLARDLGNQLGCGAFVQVLRRTRVGPFTVENAVKWAATMAEAQSNLLPMGLAVVDLPRATLGAQDLQRLCAGQTVPLPHHGMASGELAVWDEGGELAAVAEFEAETGLLCPIKVLRDQLK
jgi:tRNA pseudouridine55 synthase